jgi:phosphoribosylglycinamide formyltransferase 1
MDTSVNKINLAIFASGNGSNAEAIARYFAHHPHIHVKIILTNNKNAYVLQRAKSLGIDSMIFDRHELYDSDNKLIYLLKHLQIEYIALAGFLWLVPESLLKAYPGRIINIHPALLPEYGGRGMYGRKVHEAVINDKMKESGITIHLLNEKYDDGKILFQEKVSVDENDTPESLAEKLHKIEYLRYPPEIEKWITKK